MKKVCTKCSESKAHDDFYKNSRSKDGRNSWCKACHAARARDKYYNYGDDARIARNRERIRNEARDYIWNYLSSHPCVDCGEDDVIVLEFDHREPSEKAYTISQTLHVSIDKLSAEIAKCDVRCANCHRRRTQNQFGSWKLQRE